MDRGMFAHFTDSQFESVRKMADIFGGDALLILAAATPAEQVERSEAYDSYGEGGRPPPLVGQKGKARYGCGPHLGRATSGRYALSNLEVRRRPGRVTPARRRRRVVLQPELSCANCLVPPSAGQAMSITSARASLPTHKGSVSCMSIFSGCKYPLHLWRGAPLGRPKSPWSTDGARHGGLAPDILGALETRKNCVGLLVCTGYGNPSKPQSSLGASTNFGRRQAVARNSDKYADVLGESKGRDQISV
ncbi:LOW QUALITY PROTEIN: Gag protein [Phytophthora palmivora]|uniref:Gag protein n=1 Tax=Phytophthora palmivora TaxID=4796 RepID=A0A2P4YFE6_9STRA|nr:LOW QUALITY PROTEIN: Gag protein [Phytophthora palmivora]